MNDVNSPAAMCDRRRRRPGEGAATLREEGFDASVAHRDESRAIPFGPPPLSKTYFDRRKISKAVVCTKPPGWYEEHDIEPRVRDLGVAAAIPWRTKCREKRVR